MTEAKLSGLAEILPVALFRIDTAGECTAVNDHWRKLTGMSTNDALGKGWINAVHPLDRERVAQEWERNSSYPRGFTSSFRYLSPDQLAKTVSCEVLPLFDEGDNLVGHLATAFDMTERNRTEVALRETARELEKRVKELHCLFEISRIVERSGGTLPTILRETVKILPGSLRFSAIACARILMDGENYATSNYTETPWRQRADILVYGEPAGEIEVGYLEEKHWRDEGPFLEEERDLLNEIAERLGRITERLLTRRRMREQEHEVRERMTHLTRVSTMGEMASSIAHEVNQPLTAIATYAQACRRLVEAGMIESLEVREVLGRISDEALRAGSILHRLKDLVRKRGSRLAKQDLNALIRDIENLASVDARLHDVSIRFALEPHLPTVLVDGIQIQQVVLNLIRNGIDALEETESSVGEVVVRTRAKTSDEIEVSVSDNGCGLPEGAEESLFRPFFTTKAEGMGLGLSISRSILASHGGRISFSRNAAGGATFSFSLPVAGNPKECGAEPKED